MATILVKRVGLVSVPKYFPSLWGDDPNPAHNIWKYNRIGDHRCCQSADGGVTGVTIAENAFPNADGLGFGGFFEPAPELVFGSTILFTTLTLICGVTVQLNGVSKATPGFGWAVQSSTFGLIQSSGNGNPVGISDGFVTTTINKTPGGRIDDLTEAFRLGYVRGGVALVDFAFQSSTLLVDALYVDINYTLPVTAVTAVPPLRQLQAVQYPPLRQLQNGAT